MNEADFRKMVGMPTTQTGAPTPQVQPQYQAPQAPQQYAPPPQYPQAPNVPPAPSYAASGAPSQRYQPRSNGGWQGKKGGFSSSLKLPLTVRQSKKDGRFYLAGNISFSVEVDQQMFQQIAATGQGIGEYKAGEVNIWPPFNKTKQGE